MEMAIEGIPETEDLAGFLLSTLGRGIAKLVDEVRMEEIAGIQDHWSLTLGRRGRTLTQLSS